MLLVCKLTLFSCIICNKSLLSAHVMESILNAPVASLTHSSFFLLCLEGNRSLLRLLSSLSLSLLVKSTEHGSIGATRSLRRRRLRCLSTTSLLFSHSSFSLNFLFRKSLQVNRNRNRNRILVVQT